MSETPPAELRARADAGDAEAQCDVGRWYAEHSTDPDRVALAERWFQVAASRGVARAKHNLGVLAVQQGDLPQGMRLLKEAGEGGWLPSLLAYGHIALQMGDAVGSAEAFRTAAAMGSGDAEAELGWIAFGEDNDASNAEAFRLSSSAAAKGSLRGMVTLGMILNEGRGRRRDKSAAVMWFVRAARLGHAGAQMMAGVAYEQGHAVRIDRVEAAAWYTLAAQNQHEGGLTMLRSLWGRLASEERDAVTPRVASIREQWPAAGGQPAMRPPGS